MPALRASPFDNSVSGRDIRIANTAWLLDAKHQDVLNPENSRPHREPAALKVQLEDLTWRVLCGELPTGPAVVANQLINTRLRAVELEQHLREIEEMERQVEELADALKRKESGEGRSMGSWPRGLTTSSGGLGRDSPIPGPSLAPIHRTAERGKVDFPVGT
jgi:hypothetical protein